MLVSTLIPLPPGFLFRQGEFADLWHAHQQAHAALMEADPRLRAVLLEQGLSPQLCLALLPISIQQVDTKTSQTEATAKGQGVNHGPYLAGVLNERSGRRTLKPGIQRSGHPARLDRGAAPHQGCRGAVGRPDRGLRPGTVWWRRSRAVPSRVFCPFRPRAVP